MEAPQIVMVCVYTLALGVALAEHGKEKRGRESFGLALVSVAIQVGILWWGGFWGQ